MKREKGVRALAHSRNGRICCRGGIRAGCGIGRFYCALPLRYLSAIWSGGDLLSHVLRRSTIGATGLNGRVRDGIGCFPRAVTTRPSKLPAGSFEGRATSNRVRGPRDRCVLAEPEPSRASCPVERARCLSRFQVPYRFAAEGHVCTDLG